ncbi:MAG: hypothetical protein U9R75_01115 [Candidatus Thermoplasmatota archaeon]|nr:hypothetical protein [Candidatus Thermoplasmatota archaeon]
MSFSNPVQVIWEDGVSHNLNWVFIITIAILITISIVICVYYIIIKKIWVQRKEDQNINAFQKEVHKEEVDETPSKLQ